MGAGASAAGLGDAAQNLEDAVVSLPKPERFNACTALHHCFEGIMAEVALG